MERVEIAIIGTGPAGLEAAITATLRNKKILLIGDPDLSGKLRKAHRVDNYLGLPEIAGSDLAKVFQAHLDKMGIEILQDRIGGIYSMGDYFALQGGKDNYEAETVILASGVVMEKPILGEQENLGRGVSYCATCDAALYRGKTALVLGYSPEEEAEVAFLAEVAEKVTYLPQYRADEYPGLGNAANIIVEKDTPLEILKEEGGMVLKTSSGSEYHSNGIFVLREATPPDRLVPGLPTEGNAVVCDRLMRTGIEGIFAAGDITGAPYQYIKAAGEGNIAALSAVNYLTAKRRNAGA